MKFPRGYPSLLPRAPKFLQKKTKQYRPCSTTYTKRPPPSTYHEARLTGCVLCATCVVAGGSPMEKMETASNFVLEVEIARATQQIGGRPCVALRTPSQLCKIVSAQPKLRPARQSVHWTTDRGRTIIPRCLCPSRQRRVLHHSSRLVFY